LKSHMIMNYFSSLKPKKAELWWREECI
jgi:hypothetical protein